MYSTIALRIFARSNRVQISSQRIASSAAQPVMTPGSSPKIRFRHFLFLSVSHHELITFIQNILNKMSFVRHNKKFLFTTNWMAVCKLHSIYTSRPYLATSERDQEKYRIASHRFSHRYSIQIMVSNDRIQSDVISD